MAGIDDVLERLVTDDAFRTQLASDPDAALTGYDLTDEDRALLDSQVSSDAGQAGTMEGRTSKAGLFGLLGGLDEIADALSTGANADADAYDYPGDYADRFDGATPAADAKPTYLAVSLEKVAISEYDASSDPAAPPEDLAGTSDAAEAGGYSGDPVARYHLEQAWPKAEADGPGDLADVSAAAATDAEPGDAPMTYQNTFTAIPDSTASEASPAHPPTPGGVMHQDDWEVQGDDARASGHEAAHVVQQDPAASTQGDSTADLPNASDMDFVARPATDAAAGDSAAIEDQVAFAYKSIDLSPGEQELPLQAETSSPPPAPGQVAAPDADDSQAAGAEKITIHGQYDVPSAATDVDGSEEAEPETPPALDA